MKAVVLTLLLLLPAAALADPSAGQVQMQCMLDRSRAESIQAARIMSHDSMFEMMRQIRSRYKKGQPVGEAQSEMQIAVKDLFFEKTLDMIPYVYDYDGGMAPDKVGMEVLNDCLEDYNNRRLWAVLKDHVS